VPEEILDLDFFWTPDEEATTSSFADLQFAGPENHLHQSVTEGIGK
jgi:hypothetical protein